MIMSIQEVKVALESIYHTTDKRIANQKMVNLVNTINLISPNREELLQALFKMYDYNQTMQSVDVALVMTTSVNKKMFERKAVIFFLKDKYEKMQVELPRSIKIALSDYK